ncbi:lysoplasmalogenase [Robertkochia flava]|uniref:lysoplasmalogenase n=1 Tax=Robertkochia flava TaxID=3447986 RepID=UPI001CC94ACD|nr:lysoplasmalogenase [Robertkochia marina]
MMSSLTFYIIYFGLLISDLILIISHPEGFWRPFFEPLMILLLLFHFRQNHKEDNTCNPKQVQIALVSIILGGLFLMNSLPVYSFLAGFCFFLLANILYTILFYRCADLRVKRAIPFIVIASVLSMILLYVFYEHLGDYFIPASFYIFVLLNCMQAAFLRYKVVNDNSFYLTFIGMVLFFISQVAAAFYHFIDHSTALKFIVIISFFLSQFLIVKGVLINTREPEDIPGMPAIPKSPLSPENSMKTKPQAGDSRLG